MGLGGAAVLAGVVFHFLPIGAKAQSQANAQQTAATLDRMIAAHKSQSELAQFVFETHGCKACHTVGQNGKLGFTPRGQQVGGDFEGCIRLLTDVSLIAKMPESRRSDQQRHKVTRFQEFGCTFCHQVDGEKVGLTGVGAKLTHLHLGCVDIEKNVARSGLPPR
jgi:cytochrome c551/c552